MSRHKLDESGAGATISLVAVFLLSCFLFIMIGYGIDRIIMASINMAPALASTQMRYDTIGVMITAFRFEPFIILVGVGINTWVVSNRTTSGEVDLGGMMWGAAEMILLTLGMIALTMFGGAAIETVVSVVNNVPYAVSTQPGLYSAVGWIGPVFYGLCFLGLCGAIIQFLMQCVQTVDYEPSY